MSRAKYVGVTVNQFVAKGIAHVGDVKGAVLFANLGVECNVQQHVAQLFLGRLVVVANEGIAQFIGLFYGIGTQAFVGLFVVPGAFLAQNVEYVDQSTECFGLFFFGV